MASERLLSPRTHSVIRPSDGPLLRGARLAFGFEQPVRAALLVGVEDLAVVAAHALREHDLALADRAPLALFLAELALAALGPALDLEDREQRDEPERGAERAQEPAIE